ncbi:DUF6089 family protein [Spirosoma sp. KUDC1026]|uniref:DUF6089 family protein n=1 Tax=Spirosoma sp. KUDC1026 TaxID=2745947 RepID=UPI00159B8B20|nr:DUF6089 family protein [Spirosoma sp. KUDC1026]QKZ15238.1 outer membrane beta-barrel protein [Spirosoma sp. KUDC1026]
MNKYKYLVAGVATVLALAGSASSGLAQRKPNTQFTPYSSVSFGAGSSHYYGDLAGYKRPIRATFILPRWNVGLGYTRQFTPNFAARASFTWARITGDDYTFYRDRIQNYLVQYTRNLHFRNDLKEFAVTGIYNFIPDGRSPERRAKITPYLFAGIALVAHSPEARTPAAPNNEPYAAQEWVKLQPLHTEGQGQPGRDKPYSLVTASIPVGIGARYRINDMFNVGVEIGFRYTFTDYLDDVGGPYADPTSLEGLARVMGDRRFEQNAARYKNNPPNRYQVLTDLFTNGSPDLQAAIQDALTTQPARGADGYLNDGYLLTNISIQYVIPSKIKCPPIR